jgi:iron complex outermembrane recepter protein
MPVRITAVCGCVLVLSCLCAVSPLAAQTSSQPSPPGLTIEQLLNVDVQRVVGASRFNQEVVDAPASVTIITREEIYTFGYRTLGEVLRSVRGFYVSNDRNYSYLGVRGFSRPGDYNTRVLLLVDGHRMNDDIYDQAAIGTDFPVDTDLVDHIEVIRGPASSLYGTSAFFGVINVVTVRPSNAGRAFGTVEAGSQGTIDVRGGAAGTKNGAEGLFGVTGYRTSGQRRIFFPELATTPTGGVSEGADGDSFWNILANARRGGWSGELVWGTRTKHIPTGAWETMLSDPRSATTDDRGFASVGYDGRFRGATIAWRGAYDRYRYDGTYAALGSDGTTVAPYSDFGYGNWLSSEFSMTRQGGRRHLLTGGIEGRANLRQDQGTTYPDDPASSFVALHDSRTWSVYVEDQFRLSSKLLLQAGIRHDDLHPVRNANSPRVALIFKPRPTESVKLLVGQAFRAPNAYELYYYTLGSAAPLSGERIRSVDAVWERYFGKRARVSADAFVYQTRDLITERPGASPDGIQFLNSGRMKAEGFEFETETVLPAGLHATGAYTYAHASQADATTPLSNSPRHLAQLRLAVPLGVGGLLAGVEHIFVGEREGIDGSRVPSTFLCNVTLTRRASHGVAVGLDIKNLFDRLNTDPGNEEHPTARIPQNGRTARVRITWQF